jgi:hypothetical protein
MKPNSCLTAAEGWLLTAAILILIVFILILQSSINHINERLDRIQPAQINE